jgi:hypothetical protein
MLEYADILRNPDWYLFHARRATIKDVFKKRGIISRKERKVYVKFFNISESAIYQDFLHFLHEGRKCVLYPSELEKQRIYKRDGKTCCYCGNDNAKNYLIEHVIPVSKGGVGVSYNLVVSCWSCNIAKKSEVWIPCNLEEITSKNKDWIKKVVEISSR